MKNRTRMIIVLSVIVLILLLSILNKIKKAEENTGNLELEETIENAVIDSHKENLQKVNVTGYHLVTYPQSANTNSFIQSITVTALQDANIHFVIGSIDKNSFVQERTAFDIPCKAGENTFELVEKRYLIKQGEYLFMDMFGQDVLYTQENATVKSLVQNENNKVSGKMIMSQSNYVLPFKYTLETVKNYNVLVFGKDIAHQEASEGIQSIDEKLDYYEMTKARLEKTFNSVTMNRFDAVEWERNETRQEWITNFLNKQDMTNLDLVIFQLGENDEAIENLEKDMTDLVQTIRKVSPNVELIWMSGWNSDDKMLDSLPGICERLKMEWIDISDLNGAEYQSLITEDVTNNEVILPEIKKTYAPNREAMQIISNRIMEVLKFDF